MAAPPSLAPSLTPSLHSKLAADIGNISRITKTHKSLSITPKPLPDLKQSMAFEVSAFGVQGKGRGGAGWERQGRAGVASGESNGDTKRKWLRETVLEVVMEGEERKLKMNTERWSGGVCRTSWEEGRGAEGTWRGSGRHREGITGCVLMRVSAAPSNRCNPALTLRNDLANKFHDLAVPQSITRPCPESQCKGISH